MALPLPAPAPHPLRAEVTKPKPWHEPERKDKNETRHTGVRAT